MVFPYGYNYIDMKISQQSKTDALLCVNKDHEWTVNINCEQYRKTNNPQGTIFF